jgi:cell division protein ZapA
MATIELEIGGRKYAIACRDGEEEHLRGVSELVNRKAHEAELALGSLGEARQLLFASLLLADEVNDLRAGKTPTIEVDPAVAEALEKIAGRMESLAERLEAKA